jgi:hypothetical protein
MKLFTKADNTKLFSNYLKGSDMENQNVVVKIFNPYGKGTWYIMNSDPNDPDYLWGIVDLGQGVEIGSISRSDLENYRNRFGWGFERDLSFRPKNAKEVYEGLKNGKFFVKGGKVGQEKFVSKPIQEGDIFYDKPNAQPGYYNQRIINKILGDKVEIQIVDAFNSYREKKGSPYTVSKKYVQDVVDEIAKEKFDAEQSKEKQKNEIIKKLKLDKYKGGVLNTELMVEKLYNELIEFQKYCNDNFSQENRSVKAGYYGSTQLLATQTGQAITLKFNNSYNRYVPYFVAIQIGGALDSDLKQVLKMVSKYILEKYTYSNEFGKSEIRDEYGSNYTTVMLTSPTSKDGSYYPRISFFGKFENGGFMNGVYAGGGEVEFIEYGDSEIMYEPHYKKYYANEMEFDNLEDAKKFIDSGEVPYFIKDAYAKGLFKKGGRLLSTRERYIAELKGLSGLQQKAIEDYIDENNLTSDEILHIVIGLGRKQISRSDVSTAIVGKKNNAKSKKLLAFAMSKESLKAEYGAFMDNVYAGGGKIIGDESLRKARFFDNVLYKNRIWEVTQEDGKVGLISPGYAFEESFDFIPITKINVEEVTDMQGNKLKFPIDANDFDNFRYSANGGLMDGVYAGGGSISNFDPMSLIGKTFYSLQSHGKIINVRILSNDNIKIKYEVSNTFNVEKSFTKKELFDMAKGKEVDGNSILKSTMAYGGKTTFAEKSRAIAKNFVGKSVEPKYQKEYGKTYDAKEAKEVGNKIAGKQKASYDKKYMSYGGDFPDYGETVNGQDIDYDMKDYFNRTNKKLLITTKDKKQHINGAVTKFYNDLIFVAKDKHDIPVKDILKVEILKDNTANVEKPKNSMKVGGTTKRGGNIKLITEKAKEIRKPGEKWTDAVRRASAMMK